MTWSVKAGWLEKREEEGSLWKEDETGLKPS